MSVRAYGRTPPDEFGASHWVEVQTDAQGFSDLVYVTALAQVLKLSLGESPFYADYGIPAKQSVLTQVAPDVYAALTQQRYARYFASLLLARVDVAPKTLKEEPVPTYRMSILTNYGVVLHADVPIPT